MANPQGNKLLWEDNDCGKPGLSGVIDKAVVKDALMEILRGIPGVKDLLSKSSGTSEVTGQQTGQEADKYQSAAKSKQRVLLLLNK